MLLMTKSTTDFDRRFGIVMLSIGLLMYLTATNFRTPRLQKSDELSVAPPVPLQLLASIGDRFLAANVAVWRTLMVGADSLPREVLKAQARIQENASFFNPSHEDNYVIATAILPWEGFVVPTQTILRRATEVRKTDPYAPFFYGFNQIHFLNDAKTAYKYGQLAVSYAQDDQTRQALTVISAAWSERGDDPSTAVRIIRSLAESAKDAGLKHHLLQRARRQEIIIELQASVDAYIHQTGRVPVSLEQLFDSGGLSRLPEDPLGSIVFIIQENGTVGFKERKR